MRRQMEMKAMKKLCNCCWGEDGEVEVDPQDLSGSDSDCPEKYYQVQVLHRM